MTHHFHITLAADVTVVARFRRFVRTSLGRTGLDPSAGADMAAAVAEACRIITLYGYADLEPGSIELGLTVDMELIRADIVDFGRPFEPVEAILAEDDPETVDIELPEVFGRLQRIEYHADPNGNHLIMVQGLSHTEESSR